MRNVSAELTSLSAVELARKIRSRQVSSREVVQAHLARAAEWNPKLNAIVHLDSEGALQQAAAADEAQANGRPLGRLHGVPLTIKASIDVKGLRCECGSRFRQGNVAEHFVGAQTEATLRQALARQGIE